MKKYIFVAIVLVVSVMFVWGCQSTPIDIEARDLLDKYNLHSDYIPGVVSLTDRSSFAPEKLAPDNLVFEGVYKIELSGPWNEHDWGNKVELKEPQEMNSFISMFRQSVQRRGYSSPTIDDENYLIIYYYSDGPRYIFKVALYTA